MKRTITHVNTTTEVIEVELPYFSKDKSGNVYKVVSENKTIAVQDSKFITSIHVYDEIRKDIAFEPDCAPIEEVEFKRQFEKALGFLAAEI